MHASIPLSWVLLALVPFGALAQGDSLLLANDEHYVMGEIGDDPSSELNGYARFNSTLGGEGIRNCNGRPCEGWVEDHYPSGQLKHRGNYVDGHVVVFKNYHPNGQMEREFKAIDAIRCVQRTWHANGTLRSETNYADGFAFKYEDHYIDGQLRYAEERGRKDPYFIRMDLFAADGTPISLLSLVDRKRVIVEQKEFHPGGALRCIGRSQYNPQRMDSQRIGTWTYYDVSGNEIKQEEYIGGVVHAVK
jgi:antitoxin component YwqK of YwqJK toxin-antitoxin module